MKVSKYLIITLVLLTSCYTQKSITGKNQPISYEVLQQLKSGVIYEFHHNNGITSAVRIETVTNAVVVGELIQLNGTETKNPFKSDYDEIILNINRITTRKVNWPWTIAATGITFGTLYWLLFYEVEYDFN